MFTLISVSIVIYAWLIVRSRTGVSSDTILASTVALLGFDVLLLTVGLTVESIVFLGCAVGFTWVIEAIRQPRFAMFRLPGGVVVGFGVQRIPAQSIS